MSNTKQNISVRWLYLVIGIIAMLFAGIIYAWSILKAPFASEFGWTTSNLALNFTLTMTFFCIGGFLGAKLAKRIGYKATIIISGILAAVGFVLTSLLNGSNVVLLYLTYGLLAGLGIGIAYNVLIATVSAWFPDKKGLCSGCLMMGFGASALILGNLAASMMEGAMGWRTTYLILGIALGVVLVIAGLLLKRPDPDLALPQSKPAKAASQESFESRDFTTGEMLRRPSFWMAFLCLVFLTAVGSSVISFAKDLALSVGAAASLATTLVGVLSICNGLGRIITGAVFDAMGRRFTMIAASVITVVAAGVTLLAVSIGSLPLCIAGLCLTGISYGSSPTVSSAFISAFYGQKYFSTNFSIVVFNMMFASFIATGASSLLVSSGGYVVPFIMLLILTVVSLVLNLCIRKP